MVTPIISKRGTSGIRGANCRVYHPCLAHWNASDPMASNLVEVSKHLQEVFSKEPPVYAKPPPTPAPGQGQGQQLPLSSQAPQPKSPAASGRPAPANPNQNANPPLPPKPGQLRSPTQSAQYQHRAVPVPPPHTNGHPISPPPRPPLPPQIPPQRTGVDPRYGHVPSPSYDYTERPHMQHAQTMPAGYGSRAPPPVPSLHGSPQGLQRHATMSEAAVGLSYSAGAGGRPNPLQHQRPISIAAVPQIRPQPVDLLSSDDLSSMMEERGAAPPPKPPNPEHAMLLQQIFSKFDMLARESCERTQRTLEEARVRREEMLEIEKAQREEKAEVEHLGALAERNIGVLRESIAKAESITTTALSTPLPDPNTLLTAPSVVHQQLYELVAEDAAISDTIYVLGRCLEGERVGFEGFLREVRKLGREQFMRRALIGKIVEGLGLERGSAV
ncbi:Suppressor protein stp22 of temperature-sensitive alpha-factor receptor and arginine permease [Saitoella coloradoensis]